jgi:DNA-3-methyladenine glycosylase II
VVCTERIIVAALPPFNFELSAEIFADGDRQIRTYEKGKFRQTIRNHGKLILATVESLGTVNKPKLCAELKSDKKLTREEKKKAEGTISVLFNLSLDLSSFYEEVKKDRIMACLTQRLRGLRSPTTQTVFEALVDSIVEQQISLKVANAMEKKLIRKFGDILSLNGEVYFAYPTPQTLASATIEELRQCGLSFRKAEYIKSISTLMMEGKLDLEALKGHDDADLIIRELDRLRGVGVWTAELTLLRGVQRLEALPAEDLGLRRVISHYYCGGEKITGAQARQIARDWGTWKGLAAYYLIVAEMLGIEV